MRHRPSGAEVSEAVQENLDLSLLGVGAGPAASVRAPLGRLVVPSCARAPCAALHTLAWVPDAMAWSCADHGQPWVMSPLPPPLFAWGQP